MPKTDLTSRRFRVIPVFYPLKCGKSQKIVLRKNLAVNPVITKGDPAQLQNAFLNIALNARDAIEDKGEIVFSSSLIHLNAEECERLSLNARGAYARIEISDDGAGMDKNTLDHIFEPFFTTKGKNGTGMGLAAVYGTVRNHNGALKVESELGKGSRFIIFLPAVGSIGTEGEKEDEREASVNGLTVMIVDDDDTIRGLSEEILNDCGCEVRLFSNGLDAVRFYEKSWRDVDIVLLDMIMPDMDGSETYLKLKEINPSVKVVLWSGYNSDGKAQEILDAGCDHFLHKPFRHPDLLAAISKVVNNPEPR